MFQQFLYSIIYIKCNTEEGLHSNIILKVSFKLQSHKIYFLQNRKNTVNLSTSAFLIPVKFTYSKLRVFYFHCTWRTREMAFGI